MSFDGCAGSNGVPAASLAQGGVFLPASGVSLHGDAGPVVGGVGEAVVGGLAAEHDPRLDLPDPLVTGATPHRQRSGW